jgi:hypothetical protein
MTDNTGNQKTSEDRRYSLYKLGAHLSWWGAFAWTTVLTYVNLTRPAAALPNTFQRVSGLFIILLMGVAIALGSALSRMRLAKTISRVFEVGVTVASDGARQRQQEIINMLQEELASREGQR